MHIGIAVFMQQLASTVGGGYPIVMRIAKSPPVHCPPVDPLGKEIQSIGASKACLELVSIEKMELIAGAAKNLVLIIKFD